MVKDCALAGARRNLRKFEPSPLNPSFNPSIIGTVNMKTPSWFNIVEQWRAKAMGAYGVTLPFLAGALAYEKGQDNATLDDVTGLLTEMIENPVEGYMAIIRWCGDIEEPVISMKALDDPFKVSIRDGYRRPNGNEWSVAFTEDLMSMFNLNCATAQECRVKLANHAKSHVENGLFSKNINPNTQLKEFGRFSQRDIEYIKSVIHSLVCAET